MADDSAMDARSVLDALREQGADRVDPVRFRFIEALARRAEDHEGPTRRILDERLEVLLKAFTEEVDKAARHEDATAQSQAARTPLADLLAQTGHAEPVAPDAELESLDYFRDVWSRLSMNRRLTQSLAKMPENAGPLNSHHLVHRALTLMREVSPEYLQRFMSYVDTLLWIDQANSQLSASAAAPSASPRPRKPARGSASR